jgi:hypothetical protein
VFDLYGKLAMTCDFPAWISASSDEERRKMNRGKEKFKLKKWFTVLGVIILLFLDNLSFRGQDHRIDFIWEIFA